MSYNTHNYTLYLILDAYAPILTHCIMTCHQRPICVTLLYPDEKQLINSNTRSTLSVAANMLHFFCFSNQSGSKFSLGKLYIRLNIQQVEWKK